MSRTADQILEMHRRGEYREGMTRAEVDARDAEDRERLRWEHADGVIERTERAQVMARIERQLHLTAFRSYLVHGAGDDLRDRYRRVLADFTAENRDLSVATNSAGGYLVPSETYQAMTIGMRRGSAMLRACNLLHTRTGAPLYWPTLDDTGNTGAILAENNAATEQDLTFGQRGPLSAFMYTSRAVQISVQLDQDAGVSIDTLLGRVLGARVGRAVNAHLTNGSGGGVQPLGLTSLTATVTGAAGSGTTPSVTLPLLTDLIHSVDVEYLEQIEGDPITGHVGFMTNNATLKLVRGVNDASGVSVVSNGPGTTILGWPVVINPDMPSPGPNAKILAFGNFGAGYVARSSRGSTVLQRLEERFGDSLQIGYQAHGGFDGRPDDPATVKLYALGS